MRPPLLIEFANSVHAQGRDLVVEESVSRPLFGEGVLAGVLADLRDMLRRDRGAYGPRARSSPLASGIDAFAGHWFQRIEFPGDGLSTTSDRSWGVFDEGGVNTLGRSLTSEDAMRPEVMIAWEMNGEPLPAIHGFPVRLVVPGWYGVANTKWLNHIHAQDTRFVGRFMSRDYVTLTGEQVGDEVVWNESLVARIRVKSMVARLTRNGSRYTAHGMALAGALPFRSIEVRVDDAPWQRATMDPQNSEYSWQLFSYQWNGLTAGAHTIVSRATAA